MPIVNLIKNEVDQSHPDSDGNFIERNLAEIAAHDEDNDHVFHKSRGIMHLKATILDLFFAGKQKIKEALIIAKF